MYAGGLEAGIVDVEVPWAGARVDPQASPPEVLDPATEPPDEPPELHEARAEPGPRARTAAWPSGAHYA